MLGRIGTVLEMIKVQHSLFALPWAFVAAFYAARGMPDWAKMGWILLAMVAARSAAMAFNRAVDSKIDAENPRTKMRAIPAGKLTVAGKLTIKGKTADVSFPLSVKPEGGKQVFEGQLPIKRLAFNIGEGEWKDTSMVADEVLIKFRVAAGQ